MVDHKLKKTDWKEETTGLAIELAGMVMEGIVSNKKKQTFHVSRIAGKLQKIIDRERAAERKRMVELYKPILEVARYLSDMHKEIPGDMWTKAIKAMETIEQLTKRAGTGKTWNEIRLRRGRLDDIVLDNGDMHLEDMAGNVWWLGFYRGNKRTSFFIRSKSEITVEIQDNELEAKLIEQEKEPDLSEI